MWFLGTPRLAFFVVVRTSPWKHCNVLLSWWWFCLMFLFFFSRLKSSWKNQRIIEGFRCWICHREQQCPQFFLGNHPPTFQSFQKHSGGNHSQKWLEIIKSFYMWILIVKKIYIFTIRKLLDAEGFETKKDTCIPSEQHVISLFFRNIFGGHKSCREK